MLECVHGFKGSGVQGSILVLWLHLGCEFTGKASASSGHIQNLEPNWQFLWKTSIFNEDFGPSIPSLSLTVNVEPRTCELLLHFGLFTKKRTGSGLHFRQINISRDPLNNKKFEESKLKQLTGINVWMCVEWRLDPYGFFSLETSFSLLYYKAIPESRFFLT